MLTISALAFVSALVSSTFGFGAGLVLTPLLSFFMPLPQAIAIGAIIFLFTSGSKVFWYRQEIDRPHFIRGALLALPGLFFGFAVISWLDLYWLELCYGVLLLFFAFNLIWPRAEGARLPAPLYPPLGGFLSAVIHAGGPFTFAYCRAYRLGRVQTVATMAALHFSNNIFKGIFFGTSGLLSHVNISELLPACIVAVVGTRLGRTVLKKYVDERLFSLGVGVILLLLSARYLLRGF